MWTTAFGLSEEPFEIDPDADEACMPNPLASLLTELQAGLRCPRGLSALVGDDSAVVSRLAGAFARRLAGVADVARVDRAANAVSAVCASALERFGVTAVSGADSTALFSQHVASQSARSRTSVVLIEGAERLSPQTLEGLAALVESDDDEQRLHFFLFGTQALLDRMQAAPEEGLLSGVLQICRVPSLGVRDSVRYLERRLARHGGELGRLFDEAALEEVVVRSLGSFVDLEDLARSALRVAAARGAKRVGVADVADGVGEKAKEEGMAMAGRQEHLRFAEAAPARDLDDESIEWGDEEDDDEEWESEEAEGEDLSLAWSRGEDGLDEEDEDFEEQEEEEEDDEDEDDEDAFVGRAAGASKRAVSRGRAPGARDVGKDGRRPRLVGPAVVTVAACLGLVWLANHLPGPSQPEPRGRDAVLFATPVAAEPERIYRLADNPAAADASAHVRLWYDRAEIAERSAPPKAAGATTANSATTATPPDEAVGGPSRPSPAAVAEKGGRAVASAAPTPRPPASVDPATAGRPAAKPAVATASSSRFTVQLGAFKARSNAESLTRKVGRASQVVSEGGLYRVVSGAFPTRQQAVDHAGELARAGYPGFVRTAAF